MKTNVIIMGHLGKNPEITKTKNNKTLCTFTVAEKIENQDKPFWHNVVVWDEEAENCNKYLVKGSKVFVQGRVNESEYIDKSGEKKKIFEINAQNIGFPMSK
jgi:single-strand DNA-binding protein